MATTGTTGTASTTSTSTTSTTGTTSTTSLKCKLFCHFSVHAMQARCKYRCFACAERVGYINSKGKPYRTHSTKLALSDFQAWEDGSLILACAKCASPVPFELVILKTVVVDITDE